MRTNFCSCFVNKCPGDFAIQKSEITLLRRLRYPVILTKRFLTNIKNLKFIIDVIGKVRYIDYGERRYRESRTAPILEIEKNDRAEMLGNDIRPTGAKLYQQAR